MQDRPVVHPRSNCHEHIPHVHQQQQYSGVFLFGMNLKNSLPSWTTPPPPETSLLRPKLLVEAKLHTPTGMECVYLHVWAWPSNSRNCQSSSKALLLIFLTLGHCLAMGVCKRFRHEIHSFTTCTAMEHKSWLIILCLELKIAIAQSCQTLEV